jgi:hypothetical protein
LVVDADQPTVVPHLVEFFAIGRFNHIHRGKSLRQRCVVVARRERQCAQGRRRSGSSGIAKASKK